MTVGQLSEMVNAVTLFIAGRMLAREALLGELKEESTLVAVSPIDGGGKDKKRKKKTKKTPKKKPHVQKKNKLGLLKLYKVQGDKVESLREYCERCGPGVRMAKHANRVHCGRCGMSAPIAGGAKAEAKGKKGK